MTSNLINPNDNCIVQTYIQNPLLIDDKKFTLRLYVLIICIDPLRIMVYKEGICTLCTTSYRSPDPSNIENLSIHITSHHANKWKINKNSRDDFDHKRSTNWLWNWFVTRGYDKDKVWRDLCDIIVKTVITVQAPVAQAVNGCKIDGLNKNPFSCFEVYIIIIINTFIYYYRYEYSDYIHIINIFYFLFLILCEL